MEPLGLPNRLSCPPPSHPTSLMPTDQAEDPMEQLPQEFVMMARVSVLLRGCASAFGMRMRTAPSWAEVAHSMLSKEDPER